MKGTNKDATVLDSQTCPDCGRPIAPVVPTGGTGTIYLEPYFITTHLNISEPITDQGGTEVPKTNPSSREGQSHELFSTNYFKTRDLEMATFCSDALIYLKKHKLVYQEYTDKTCPTDGSLTHVKSRIIPSSYEDSDEDDPEEDLDSTLIESVGEESIDAKEIVQEKDESIKTVREKLKKKYGKISKGPFTDQMQSWLQTELKKSRTLSQTQHLARKMTVKEAKEEFIKSRTGAKAKKSPNSDSKEYRMYKGSSTDASCKEQKVPKENKRKRAKNLQEIFNVLLKWRAPEEERTDPFWDNANTIFKRRILQLKHEQKCDDINHHNIEFYSLKSSPGCDYNKIKVSEMYAVESESKLHLEEDDPRYIRQQALHRMAAICGHLTRGICRDGLPDDTSLYRSHKRKIRKESKKRLSLTDRKEINLRKCDKLEQAITKAKEEASSTVPSQRKNILYRISSTKESQRSKSLKDKINDPSLTVENIIKLMITNNGEKEDVIKIASFADRNLRSRHLRRAHFRPKHLVHTWKKDRGPTKRQMKMLLRRMSSDK